MTRDLAAALAISLLFHAAVLVGIGGVVRGGGHRGEPSPPAEAPAGASGSLAIGSLETHAASAPRTSPADDAGGGGGSSIDRRATGPPPEAPEVVTERRETRQDDVGSRHGRQDEHVERNLDVQPPQSAGLHTNQPREPAPPPSTPGDREADSRHGRPAASAGRRASPAADRVSKRPRLAAPLQPEYPFPARRLGHEGAVVIKVLVGADGFPTSLAIKSSSGYESLDSAALEAVRDAAFIPGGGDSPIPTVVRVLFRLQ